MRASTRTAAIEIYKLLERLEGRASVTKVRDMVRAMGHTMTNSELSGWLAPFASAASSRSSDRDADQIRTVERTANGRFRGPSFEHESDRPTDEIRTEQRTDSGPERGLTRGKGIPDLSSESPDSPSYLVSAKPVREAEAEVVAERPESRPISRTQPASDRGERMAEIGPGDVPSAAAAAPPRPAAPAAWAESRADGLVARSGPGNSRETQGRADRSQSPATDFARWFVDAALAAGVMPAHLGLDRDRQAYLMADDAVGLVATYGDELCRRRAEALFAAKKSGEIRAAVTIALLGKIWAWDCIVSAAPDPAAWPASIPHRKPPPPGVPTIAEQVAARERELLQRKAERRAAYPAQVAARREAGTLNALDFAWISRAESPLAADEARRRQDEMNGVASTREAS